MVSFLWAIWVIENSLEFVPCHRTKYSSRTLVGLSSRSRLRPGRFASRWKKIAVKSRVGSLGQLGAPRTRNRGREVWIRRSRNAPPVFVFFWGGVSPNHHLLRLHRSCCWTSKIRRCRWNGWLVVLPLDELKPWMSCGGNRFWFSPGASNFGTSRQVGGQFFSRKKVLVGWE